MNNQYLLIKYYTAKNQFFPDKIEKIKMDTKNSSKTPFFSSWLEIDLTAVRSNCRVSMEAACLPLMAVVKADAYGFGALMIARACLDEGVCHFAVARLAEAVRLREAGISQDILVFTLMNRAELAEAVELGLTISLNRLEQIAWLKDLAAETKKTPKIHLKIDTGMSRFGFLPEELPEVIAALRETAELPLDGVYSHYANIDDDPADPLNILQQERFDGALQQLARAGIRPKWIHFSNSAALFHAPLSSCTMVRAGTSLIGVNPFYYQDFPDYMKKCITWKSKLVSVRRIPAGAGVGYSQHTPLLEDTWIGVIPVGYGDGYRRVSGNEVLIRGRRLPIIGSVCTDVMMVKLPERFEVDEVVVLLGCQGSESIDVEELAMRWHTSRADVTTGISARVERKYLNS